MESIVSRYIKLLTGAATILLVIAIGCKKTYNPKIVAGNASKQYLVVEGMINTGQDSTIIRLSRTVPIGSTSKSKPELGAIVTVIADANVSVQLTETGKGYYKAPGFASNSTAKYSLKITTSDGRAYQSDFVEAKKSPPIDSVYYRIKNNGVQVYADTHDPANSTKYYRWDFDETYMFSSAFQSYEYYVSFPFDTVLPRPLDKQIHVCWKNDTSRNILLNSSAKLARDVISENPVYFIPSTSEELESRCSLLVKQYALTPDAFNYFQQLKKNTEQLGSIFDAQPSELPGNIHCITDPSEQVLGYITAGTASESRIFIDNRNLPAWRAATPYEGCFMDTAYYAGRGNTNEVQMYIYSGYKIPIYPISLPGSGKIVGYSEGDPACVDCTLRGTNKRPDFWTDYQP